MEPVARSRATPEAREVLEAVRRDQHASELRPARIELHRGGRSLQATVGTGSFVTLRLDGKKVEKLKPGKYNVAVTDKSTKDNFHVQGPGLDRSTSVAKRQNATWTVTLKKGVYRYSSAGSSKRKGSFEVS